MATDIEEMAASGQQTINELEKAIQDLDEKIATIENELSTIQAARDDRETFLAESRQGLLRLEREHNQASSYAKLAQGKPNEAQAIKAVSVAKRALDNTKKEMSNLAKDSAADEAEAQAREQDLKKQLHLAQSERSANVGQLEAVKLGYSKVHNELGHERFTAYQETRERHVRDIDTLLAELVEKKAALRNLDETHVQELQAWPTLQQNIKSLIPSDDATIRVLEAEIHFLSTLLEDASQVNATAHLPSLKGSIGYTDVWSKILIPDHEIISAIKRQSPNLQIRRDVLQKLLDEYRTHLTEEHAL